MRTLAKTGGGQKGNAGGERVMAKGSLKNRGCTVL